MRTPFWINLLVLLGSSLPFIALGYILYVFFHEILVTLLVPIFLFQFIVLLPSNPEKKTPCVTYRGY